jgi:uncharacterized protein with HEPN domain
MKPSPAEPLRDIVEAGEAIERFLTGVDFEQFTSSDALTSQVYWKLALIGEAANRAMRGWPDMVIALPELINLAEVRNRVIHGYDRISNVIVWSVVREKLPPVLVQIRFRLGEME